MTELDDRRQRAREAGWDAASRITSASLKTGAAMDEAIETATRVRITPEIVAAVGGETTIRGVLRAAFHAAGFEVED